MSSLRLSRLGGVDHYDPHQTAEGCVVKTAGAALQSRIVELEAAHAWRPIGEAPKLGRILLAAEGQTCYGHWYSIYQRWEYDGYAFGNPKPQPTHWLPLPQPPKE